ncbi:MAG: hypothetical protein ABIG93_00365 [archaeon]|nr:hypothetical protein [Nanoarchaeota archaeon]
MKLNKFLLVLVALILFVSLSTLAFAQNYCASDDDCISLGEEYACDLDLFECVALDLDGLNLGTTGDSTNTTNTTTTTGTSNVTTTYSSDVETAISQLQSNVDYIYLQISTLDENNAILSEDVASLSAQLDDINSKLSTINKNLQMLSSEQSKTEELEDSVNQALAGLASLEAELGLTQESVTTIEEGITTKASRSELVRMISLGVMILVIFVALAYYITAHARHRKQLPDRIYSYLSSQIKRGTSYEVIEKKLLEQGWPKKDIKWAYNETAKQNYYNYLKSQGKKIPRTKSYAPPQNQKIVVTSVISVILMGALILFISQSVGQAVYYEGINQEDFSILVQTTLNNGAANNLFYSEVDYLQLCVEVNQDENSASYVLLKTPYNHNVIEAETCSSLEHDYTIKFDNWAEFNSFATNLNCIKLNSFGVEC